MTGAVNMPPEMSDLADLRSAMGEASLLDAEVLWRHLHLAGVTNWAELPTAEWLAFCAATFRRLPEYLRPTSIQDERRGRKSGPWRALAFCPPPD